MLSPRKMKNSDARNSRTVLRCGVASYVVLLVLIWGLENFVGHYNWLTSLLLYAPQQLFVLPFIFLGIIAVWKRYWPVVLGVFLIIPVFCVTFLGFQWRPTFSSEEDEKIALVTYNIEQLQTGPQPLNSLVQQHKIDILCLQESHGSADIKDPLPVIRKLLPDWNVTRYGELVTLTRHKVLRHAIHRLPTRVGSGILETVVEVHGKQLTVFNVHFNIPIEGLNGLRPSVMNATAVVRNQQLSLLQELTRNCHTDFVVAGDFNTPPRGPFYKDLSTRYQDAFALAGRGAGNTWHAKFPVSRIDYVFLNRDLRVNKSEVLNLQDSDHRPVLCEVEVK